MSRRQQLKSNNLVMTPSWFGRLARDCIKLWDKTQVELHGRYSGDKLVAFHEYQAHTGWTRVSVVCLLTPLPAILIVLLLDCIPLTPLEEGNTAAVWVRSAAIAALNASCLTYQFQSHVEWLRLTPRFIIAVGIAAGISATLLGWFLALIIGFPVPFVMILCTPSLFVVVSGAMFWSQRQQIRNTPQALRMVLPYMHLLVCQATMTVIYPLYNYIFISLSPTAQTAFVLVLPVIKIAFKVWIGQSLQDGEDSRPESTIFNVEVFHALFVSYCMQSSTSVRTIFVMTAFDLTLIWVSFMDVRGILRELDSTIIPSNLTVKRNTSELVHVAYELIRADPDKHTTQPQAPSNDAEPKRGFTSSSNQVVPTSPTIPGTSATRLSDYKLTTKVLQLFYLTEFIVLIEYTEVIMPIISNVYVSVLSFSWNRQYYHFLNGITPDNLGTRIANSSLYTFLELLSLLLIAVLVWRHLGFSLLHQLAYVLETRQVRIQSKLAHWVLYIVQNSTVHCGADYSFRFEWLHRRRNRP